jgi:hypothetical protein
MATTRADIRNVSAGEPRRLDPTLPHTGNLSKGLCPSCEQTGYGAFEAVAGGDQTIYKSPHRRKAEASEEPLPEWMRCEQCSRVYRTRSPDRPQPTENDQ